MKNCIQAIVITVLIVALSGCGDRKIVARVGNHIVYLNELVSYLEEKSSETYETLSYEKRLAHLKEYVEVKLKLADALNHDLDKEPDITDLDSRLAHREVYQIVIENQVIQKIIPEKNLKDRYDNLSKEARIRHLFMAVAKDVTKEEKIRTREQLEGLRHRILRGESMDALAREFSRDSLSAGKGGDLGFISWGSTRFGTLFDQAVFGLKKGELSKIIEGDKGFHVIKIDNIRRRSLPSYERERNKILGRLFQEKNTELNNRYSEFVAGIKKSYQTRYNKKSIDTLITLIDSNAGKNSLNSNNMTIVSREGPDIQNMPLVEYRGGQYTIGQFFKEIERIPPFKRPPLDTPEKIVVFLDRLMPYEMIVKWGYDRGIDRRSHIQRKIQTRIQESLIKKIEKMKVFDGSNPGDDTLQKYFEEHRGQYYESETYKVQEIFVHGKERAIEIANRAKGKENFSKLAERYNERTLTKGKKGMLGYINEKQYGPVGREVARMIPGEVSEPIPSGTYFSVVKLLDRKPRRVKTFEEVRNQVTSDLKKDLQTKAREKWLDDLRMRYAVHLYEGALKGRLDTK